ncbi:hypothetical protein EU811_21065 [Arthrobacter sp. TS-15]|nr:hypothetical protein EU811_21065 [Arthrobacter sp. TS-15]
MLANEYPNHSLRCSTWLRGRLRRDALWALELVRLVVSDQYQSASGLVWMLAGVHSTPQSSASFDMSQFDITLIVISS